MTFSSVRSFILSEISSFALLIGRTIFFHGEILSLMAGSSLATFRISTNFIHYGFRG